MCAALAALLATGCVLLEVRRQQQEIEQFARVFGHVRSEVPSDQALVVVLVRLEADRATLVDHFVVSGGGRWFFAVTPGRYALGAFEDASGDLVYRPGEPALSPREGPRLDLAPGATLRDVELVIPREGRARVQGPVDIEELRARSLEEQTSVSLGQLSVRGEVVSLDDPRFGPGNGRLGLWRPLDFLFDVGSGIYFLEEYDRARIPVLFVHGISGHPAEFQGLVGSLDRRRFQPWFYYYPSGVHLDRAGAHLSQLVTDLRHRLGFEDLFVVAHSMGGLVARSFILAHHDATQSDCIRLFVSIATPWGGHAAAQTGVQRSPVVVYSWEDMAPGSAFLEGIFYQNPGKTLRRRLPEHLFYHLVFGYQRNARRLGPSGDGVITHASALRLEAQEEATTVRGYDYDHTSLLRSPEVAAQLNQLLARASR